MAIANKFHLVEVAGNVDKLGNKDFTIDDIIFGWTRIEVPKGGFCIKSIAAHIPQGRNLDSGSYGSHSIESNHDKDFLLIFGKSVNGAAPPTLPDSNSALNLITGSAQRPYIIGSYYVDASESTELGLFAKSWHLSSNNGTGDTTRQPNPSIILEGDPQYPGTTAGYQSIWVACICAVTNTNFATSVLVKDAHTDTDDLTIAIDDNIDGEDIFAIGDELIAFASDGSSEQVIGTLTAVAADVLTVDAVAGALADDDEVCFRKPLKFFLGIEY